MEKIPIKGYATFHPLKHCLVGRGFKIEWFEEFFKDKKILDPLKRIAEETEEDFLKLCELLNKLKIKTYRTNLDIEKYSSLKDIYRPPLTPRDHFGVIGEKFYAVQYAQGYSNILKNIKKENLFIRPHDKNYSGTIDTASIVRVGKDLFWGHNPLEGDISEYVKNFQAEGFRVHLVERDYHSDAVMCVVKPNVIVSVKNIQNYKETFPNWNVLELDDIPRLPKEFALSKQNVRGRWWISGEEDNSALISFIDKWLDEWVGFVEETVFDVNMLSIDENTIVCNNYNKKVFDFFKKHQVEPIIFNFRHRYFWDGGIHCITQDLYREGTMVDYFN
jgi:hypothetical protein